MLLLHSCCCKNVVIVVFGVSFFFFFLLLIYLYIVIFSHLFSGSSFHIISIVLIINILIVAHFSQYFFSIAEFCRTSGNEQYKAKNYVAALKFYSDAIALVPNSAIYYGNRSACLFMMGYYKRSLNDSQKAVSIDDKFSKGYDRIIKCSIALGDVVTAEQAIGKLIKIDKSMKDICKKYKEKCKRLRVHSAKIEQCHRKRNFKRASK